MSEFRIYGNDDNLHLMRKMRQNRHIPHACLFYGEKGSGRKTLAEYFAMTVLCTGENVPCGTCRNCQKILHHVHPDLIPVEHSGKKQGFSVETVREICRDAIIAPNDSERKIYLFADCDNIGIPAQNTLLKLTEEPPEHVLLLFTAVSKSAFLETMLSRMMQIAVKSCTPEECFTALTEQHDCTPENAGKAIKATGGRNIGLALCWLEDSSMQEITRHVAELTLAVAQRRQYEILRILSGYEKDRTQAEKLLKLLLLQFRDACTLKYREDILTGCDRQSAELLSGMLTASRAEHLCQAVQTAYEASQASVSLKLILASLGGNLLLN
ncbi:MAG: hypothetical protein IJJ69_02890 [Oscillospiraceae bacterium]|nr:hypothetical protein [Oscillospiraceae bacterium]